MKQTFSSSMDGDAPHDLKHGEGTVDPLPLHP